MQPKQWHDGLIGAALFLAGGILVYGLDDLIEGRDMTEYRAMASIAGGPYEPVGEWTADKVEAEQDALCVRGQWRPTRVETYIDERDNYPVDDLEDGK